MDTETNTMKTQTTQPHQQDSWGLWKAEWKHWWGDVLGNDGLKKEGLDERTKLRAHVKGTPLKKSPSYTDENIADSISVGVHGSKIKSNPQYTSTSSFFPEWKAPSFERNSTEDLKRERESRIGTGSL